MRQRRRNLRSEGDLRGRDPKTQISFRVADDTDGAGLDRPLVRRAVLARNGNSIITRSHGGGLQSAVMRHYVPQV